MASQKHIYGWRPQLPDRRDHWFTGSSHTDLPANLDLRTLHEFPDVYNQGKLGSCTANSIAGAFEYNEIKEGYGTREFTPSRLFIYYNERKIEGNTGSDTGAALRDGFKSINSTGVCSEALWPYDTTKFAQAPPRECYAQAAGEKAVRFRRVQQDITEMKRALHDEQQPICFGFTVYESFESEEVAKTGVMPVPGQGEKVLGGHAVLVVGYDDLSETMLVRNSWGADWGQKGYFQMPYSFIADPDSASDFWIIETVSRPPAVPGQEGYAHMFPELEPSECGVDPAVVVSLPPRIRISGGWENTGEVQCKPGEDAVVTWDYDGDISQVNILYCCNTWTGMLGSWSVAAKEVDNSGSFSWLVPEDTPADTRYWLRISSMEDASIYTDSAYFSVVGSSC